MAESQLSVVQALPSSRDGGAPALHTPEALQVSAPLQKFPSAQVTPAATGSWRTPVAGLQLSVVHGLPSSTVGGVPAAQDADALQVSEPLQRFPSEQAVPGVTGVC